MYKNGLNQPNTSVSFRYASLKLQGISNISQRTKGKNKTENTSKLSSWLTAEENIHVLRLFSLHCKILHFWITSASIIGIHLSNTEFVSSFSDCTPLTWYYSTCKDYFFFLESSNDCKKSVPAITH